MPLPKLTTFAMFLAWVTQLVVAWVWERRGKRAFRSILHLALFAGAMLVIFVLEFFRDIPDWIEAPLMILVLATLLIAIALDVIKLKRYLKSAWTEQEKK